MQWSTAVLGDVDGAGERGGEPLAAFGRGLPGTQHQGTEVHQMGDVVASGGGLGDDHPAIAVADEHGGFVGRACDEVEQVGHGCRIVGQAGEGQVRGERRSSGFLEQGQHPIPAPCTVPGAMDEHDGSHGAEATAGHGR